MHIVSFDVHKSISLNDCILSSALEWKKVPVVVDNENIPENA